MANACDDYEQPEIDWLFNAADAISEAPNRACAVDELRKVLKAERERVLSSIEHCLRYPIAYQENLSGLIAKLRKGP